MANLNGTWKIEREHNVKELRSKLGGNYAQQMQQQTGDKSLKVTIKGDQGKGELDFTIHGPAMKIPQKISIGKPHTFTTPLGNTLTCTTSKEGNALVSKGTDDQGRTIRIMRHVENDKLMIIIKVDGEEARQVFQRCDD